ncbi:MAG: CotH kinase family protein, partial [Bacteroidota bacterium]|nr:CotH kinase family protein [Bacteroidota bacterium]
LYPNIQQVNSPFLEEWFFSNDGSLWGAERPDGQEVGTWGDGTAALNWLGPDTTTYQEYYELERSEEIDPWDHLVKVIDELNSTPIAQLEDSLNQYMNLDRALWFLACENAFGDRDSYTRKGKDDYMIYHEVESGRSSTIQVDGRSTMQTNSVSWTPFHNADDINYPLLNRVLSVPSLRQRYLAHLRTIIAEKLQTPEFNAMLSEYVDMIDAEVQSDPRKLFTYSEFQNERIAIQEFINARRLMLNANFEVSQQGPQISQVQHSVNGTAWADPLIGEMANVRATVTSTNGINSVILHYCHGLWGPFTKVSMFDDGAHDDGASGDGIYGASIPSATPTTTIRYYIEAKAANASLTCSFEPAGAEHDVYVYRVQHPQMIDPPVVINEVLAVNSWTITDDFLEYDDWIELYNNSGDAVDLSGHWLSDNGANLQKWQFPTGTVIQPFGFKIIWADDQPEQGDDHAGFGLSIDGESVWLSTPAGLVMDHVEFGPQTTDIAYARRPNGTGPFEYQDPTFNINNDFLSVPEIDGFSKIRVFPNPAKDLLMLESEEALDITIHDATMRQVYSTRIRGRSVIDLSKWSAGSYFIRHSGGLQKLVVIK